MMAAAEAVANTASMLPPTDPSILAGPAASMILNTTLVSAVMANSDQSYSFGGRLLAVLQVIPGILYWIITFTSITLPTWLFTLFSTSLTVTMNATTLLFIALLIASTISWLVRYRYLNMYARLPPEPQRKEPSIDLFPDIPEGDSKRGFSNYLDEFLSAIKVFGYLERPVFHELTRTMQTRKLMAGETLLLEEEQGFCLVVDGLVQIFVKSNRKNGDSDSEFERRQREARSTRDEADEDEEDERNRQSYQLLTEVKNGAPMSSLFSILSLFTEDVKLRHDEDDGGSSRPVSRGYMRVKSDGSAVTTDGAKTPSPDDNGVAADLASAKARDRGIASGGRLPNVPPMSLDGEGRDNGSDDDNVKQQKQSGKRKRESAHPDIVARATVDTTIAIIPATAFRRLTRVYPRASAHVVQVILTRLQRVTLTTGHAYLGLTQEVLRTEKLMNEYTTYDLPGFLRGSALERLKEKFTKERERIGPEEVIKGLALHNPRLNRRRRASSTLRKEAAAHARVAAARLTPLGPVKASNTPARVSSPAPNGDRNSVNAGDLLTNYHVPHARDRHNRLSVSQPFHTASAASGDEDSSRFNHAARDRVALQRQDSYDEDVFFRDSITDCMLKALGLNNPTNVTRKPESVEQSPRLVSFDSRSQQAVFNNAFGFIDAFDGSDGSESMASIPSNIGPRPAGNIREELSSDVEIVFFPKDSILVEQGEPNPGLYYVIDGFLDISVPNEESGSSSRSFSGMPRMNDMSSGADFNLFSSPKDNRKGSSSNDQAHDRGTKRDQARRSIYLTKPGGLAGYLGTISSRRSFVDVTAKTDVYVGFLPRASIERIVEKYPIVLLTMAKRLVSLLPRLILHIDFALEWVQVDAGQTIYSKGDESDAIYIVLNGRLRMLDEGPDGKMHVTGEYGQGDGVGEMGVLTETKRTGTLRAIRDTELAKLPKSLFNSVAMENPEITIKISRIIATRMREMTKGQTGEPMKGSTGNTDGAAKSSTMNLRTVAILPVTAGVPVVEFSSRLLQALSQIGTTNGVTSLNQASILNHLGRHAFSRMGKLKLSQHLADLEEKYGLVLYVADTNVNSPWTQTCISQADCILLVGLAEGSPSIGEFERFLLTTKTTARKELVLLHAQRYCPPGLTRRWLRNRMWINGSHHHVHMSFRNAAEAVRPQTRRFGTALKQRVQVLQAEIQKYTSRRVQQTPLYSADTPFKGDFHRLGRRLTGRSVGLVLGGGGARGIAHIGIIRALEESGVPIDLVGGTSIGAFVGALYAWDADVVPMYGRAKKFAGRMGSMWRFALDLTYPSASYTTGHEFNRTIFKVFGTAQIEDFWLEFYCNTTNISKSRPEIHTSGYVWRYVRASMSLAGLVPPLCDESGSMLLDGGYLDNLTVAHMKSLGASDIFAVDVGGLDDQTLQHYGDSLSGFWALLNRWNPLSATVNPPTLSEIQAKLAYVSSIDMLERAKSMPGCRYMQPPVTEYGTLQFDRFEEIYKKGYAYGKEYLVGLRKEGLLPGREGELEGGTEHAREVRRTMAPRRASI